MKGKFKTLSIEGRRKRCNLAADLVISHCKHLGPNGYHSRLFERIFFNERC